MNLYMATPGVDEIDWISAQPDPVIRNLLITQCYYELSQDFRELSDVSANWCTYATWASRQAGQSIRREDLVRMFEYQFRHSAAVALAVEALMKYSSVRGLPSDLQSRIDVVLRTIRPEEIFDRVSGAVARGNKKVFDEIGRLFAEYLEKFREDSFFDSGKLSGFCSGLRQGDPPDGQDLLREAFTAYYKVRFSEEPKSKAELMFFANLLVGFHEQTRLQPEIAEALVAPLVNADPLKERLLMMVLPGTWFRLRHRLARLVGRELPLDRALDRLVDQVKRLVRKVTTEYMMTLRLPVEEMLKLGRDLEGKFPASLKVITNPQLNELLSRIDPNPDSFRQSGAADWADFDERMHFIAVFFRTYHEHRPLFHPPFTENQVKDVKAGKRPAGQL